jgi:glycosyltransferase involved in cell wall biosynthesis
VGLLHDLGADCGVIVEVGDFQILASKVLSLLDDDDRWNQKIQNARRWAETHDLQWTTNELKEQLHSIFKKD